LATGDVSLVSSAFTSWSGSAAVTDNAIVLRTGSAALTDAAAAVALFEIATGTDAGKMRIAAGEQVILLQQDDNASSGNDYDAQVWLIDNTSDTITAALVGTINRAGDSAILVVADFV
jgi:hypothetical protein